MFWWRRHNNEGETVRRDHAAVAAWPTEDDEPTAEQLRDEMLSAYLDDELTRPERERIETALADDPQLRAALGGLTMVRTALGELGEERAPRSFALPAPPVPQPSAWRMRLEWVTRLGAVSAAALFAVVFFLSDDGSTPVAPASTVQDGAAAAGETAMTGGTDARSAQADGAQADGVQSDSAQADSAQADSAQADGAQADSAQADSAQADAPGESGPADGASAGSGEEADVATADEATTDDAADAPAADASDSATEAAPADEPADEPAGDDAAAAPGLPATETPEIESYRLDEEAGAAEPAPPAPEAPAPPTETAPDVEEAAEPAETATLPPGVGIDQDGRPGDGEATDERATTLAAPETAAQQGEDAPTAMTRSADDSAARDGLLAGLAAAAVVLALAAGMLRFARRS